MKYVCALLPMIFLIMFFSNAFTAEESKETDFVKEADKAILDGKYTDAVMLLRKAVDREPEDWDVRLKLIGLLVQVSGKEAEAEKEISTIIAMPKVSRENLEKIAQLCIEYDFPDEASRLYKKILKQDGPDAEIQQRLIGILIKTGKNAEANKEIDSYIGNAEFKEEDFLRLGEFCEKGFRYQIASHVYAKTVEKFPDLVEARLRLARSHASGGNIEEAQKSAEKALESKPDSPELRSFLAGLKADAGKYEDALKVYDEILKTRPDNPDALAGKADVLFLTGKYFDAITAYNSALNKEKPSALILKKLGDVLKYTGKYAEAEEMYRKAIKADADSTDAIIGLGESYLLHGKAEEAENEFYKLYDIWDAVENPNELSPQVLTNIGLACQYNDNPKDAITCFTMAQKKDSRYLTATLALGRLFLERHQPQDAVKEFDAVLKINPNHPDALAGMAEVNLLHSRFELVEENCGKALAINPNHIESLNLMALMQMYDQQWDKAIANINKSIEINPNSIDTQSFLAAYYFHTGRKDLYEEAEKKVLSINPKYAEFYRIVSHVSEYQRRNVQAIELLKKAVALNPEHAPSLTSMGMLLMREGDEKEAENFLRKSFALDSYNPRTANTINLLRYLNNDFTTEETDHFTIRWDKEKDFVLQYHIPEYVEIAYPIITSHFEFDIPEKTLFETFPEHKWFSARITGMPFIATVGACFGKVFAMDSPKKSGFDWKRVFEHEFVHAVTLQQTNFNIPFWFTEGLATSWEKNARPVDWDRMLVRMKEFNEIVPLDDLNSWFTRPKSMDQKQWAYAQSRLLTEYIYDKWGREAIVKMLKMYADNKPTAEVIKECLGIEQPEFEKRVFDHLMSIADKIPLGPKFLPDDKERLEKLIKENPDEPDININYARFLLQSIGPQMKPDQVRKAYDDACAHARKALDAYAKMSHEKYLKRSAVAHGILAYCDFQNKDYAEARKKCEEALKLDPENFSAHYYLGKLDYLEKKPDDAIIHFEKAKAQYPNMTDIQESLAAIYTEKKDDRKTIENLEEVIKYSSKPYVAAKQLLKLYIKGKQYDDAIRVSDLCLRYNVYDPEVYKLTGDAFKAKNNENLFKRNYEIGAKIAFEFGMKEVKKDVVRKMLTLGLEMDASNEKAKELLDKIGGPVKLDETAEEVKPEDPTKLRDEGKGEEKKEEEEEKSE